MTQFKAGDVVDVAANARYRVEGETYPSSIAGRHALVVKFPSDPDGDVILGEHENAVDPQYLTLHTDWEAKFKQAQARLWAYAAEFTGLGNDPFNDAMQEAGFSPPKEYRITYSLPRFEYVTAFSKEEALRQFTEDHPHYDNITITEA